MSTPLYIPSQLHDGPNVAPILIPYVDVLPAEPTNNRALILSADVGPSLAGLYIWAEVQWQFAMPIEAVSALIINGDVSELYINVMAQTTLPANNVVYRNGQLQMNTVIDPGIGLVYSVRIPSSAVAGVGSLNGLSGVLTLAAGPNVVITDDGIGTITISSSGGVTSVNNLTGNVNLLAGTNITITPDGMGGLTFDAAGAPLPPATTTTLGGVIVPASSNIAVDGAGNIDLTPAILADIDGKLKTVTSVGSGNSLIKDSTDANVNLKSIAAGTNITIVDDGLGTLTISSSGGAPIITATGDASGVSDGSGTLPLVLAGIGTPGTYKSVTTDGKGRVIAGTNPTTLAGFGITDALPLSGGSMTGSITMTTGSTVTGVPDPVNPLDAVNLQSLDAALAAAANGVSWRESVIAATTANIAALSGLLTVDGIALQANDRVLVKNQTDPTQNGVYVALAGSWLRASDMDSSAEVFRAAVLIVSGTVNGLTQWANTNTVAPVIGTDAITFGQLKGAANVYTGGAGITVSGLSIAITPTGVTPGTYKSVTVNNLGQVIAGTNPVLTSGEVTSALGYVPYNGTTNPNGYIGTGLLITGDVSGNIVGNTMTLTLASTGVTPGTYTKVTVDAKGRVTVGANLSNPEIVAALGFTPVNKAGDKMVGVLNFANSTSLAAALTTDIGAANTNDVTITGTATITSLGTAPDGSHRWVTFSAGTPTLTHNAVSLILPTAANIVAANGDTAEFVSTGGGWKCLWYQRASGAALIGAPDATKLPLAGGTLTGAVNFATSVNVAAAATTNIGAAASNNVNLTGTGTITAFDIIAAGAIRTVVFAGTPTLTHNATSLILPGAANIVASSGDVAEFMSLGAGNWKCLSYNRADGKAVIGGGSPYDTTQVFNGSATEEAAKFMNVLEQTLVVAAAPASTQVFNVASGAVQMHTVNASVNWTLNVRHSATQTLNNMMAVGDSLTIALLVTNGATPFYQTGMQIDGNAVTPKWQGGTAPLSGNASSVDAYSITIIKTGASAYQVLAAQTQYK